MVRVHLSPPREFASQPRSSSLRELAGAGADSKQVLLWNLHANLLCRFDQVFSAELACEFSFGKLDQVRFANLRVP